jgi:hypothetical protein
VFLAIEWAGVERKPVTADVEAHVGKDASTEVADRIWRKS